MSMWDSDSPGYSADRLYDFADAIKEQRKDERLSRGPEGETRYPCPEGCGAVFVSMTGMELHFLVEHEGDAA